VIASKQLADKSSRELQSIYNRSVSSEEEEEKRKTRIMEKIKSTEEILRDNKRRLERLQLEKDL
jgi:hypothetical protein